jgi:hypothetical protein
LYNRFYQIKIASPVRQVGEARNDKDIRKKIASFVRQMGRARNGVVAK